MEESYRRIWDEIASSIQPHVSVDAFQRWFAAIELIQADEIALTFQVPNTIYQLWIESNYLNLVQSATLSVLGSPRDIKFRVVDNGKANALAESRVEQSSEPPQARIQEKESEVASNHGMNPRNSFETFVVGSNNQFAHAAALAVAQSPAKTYNPLFIYGGVGLGKTHLMQAIGQQVMDRKKNFKVMYLSSEKFTNEFIDAIQHNTLVKFRKRYRQSDVLLIDDIHFLAGKERSQEEFFHTFNELHDHQKQIVISSDSPPKDIPGLLERLRSRFEWGLLADIQPPDLETKMAILDKKAEGEGVRLPDDVRSFMASKTKSNVRELEGALVKLIAYSSLTGTPINLQMSQQVLKHLVHVQDRRVTIDAIQKAVAERFQVKQSQLKEKSNTKKVVYPRQVAMYLVKELTNASLPEIGRAFGGKHHTTVLHSVDKIEEARKTDKDLSRLLTKLTDTLRG